MIYMLAWAGFVVGGYIAVTAICFIKNVRGAK